MVEEKISWTFVLRTLSNSCR